jgi:hypothetical protein
MNRARYEVPPELTNLLLDFTVSVLVNKPSDLLEYATIYFTRLLDERQHSSNLLGNVNDNENHFADEDNDSTSSDISKLLISLFYLFRAFRFRFLSKKLTHIYLTCLY